MRLKKNIVVLCIFTLFSFILLGCGTVKDKQETKLEKDYVLEIKNGERFFKSEIVPKSYGEKVILDYFKIEISDEYNDFENIFINSESFNSYPKIYKENFNNGLYTEELTVHSLEKLNEKDYSNKPNDIKYYWYMDRLKEYNPNEFEIIEVKYTNKLTDKYNETAQWGSWNWTRYFIVCKEKDDSDWKIYDIYGHM